MAFDPITYTGINSFGVPLFSFGTLGRNAITGPGINNWSLSAFKKMKFGETKSLEFRTELFNAFNHAQFIFQSPKARALAVPLGKLRRRVDRA